MFTCVVVRAATKSNMRWVGSRITAPGCALDDIEVCKIISDSLSSLLESIAIMKGCGWKQQQDSTSPLDYVRGMR